MKPTFDDMRRILLPQFSRHFSDIEPTKQELIDFASPILASYDWTIEEFISTLHEYNKSQMREDRNRRKELRKQHKEQRKVKN